MQNNNLSSAHHRRNTHDISTMWRTRLLVGLLSFAHGMAGALFFDGSLRQVIDADFFGRLWALGLMLCGAMMVISAAAERRGHTKRWCREFSASMLGAVWLGLFFQALDDAAWSVALSAPIYFAFCAWSFWAEANAARANVIAHRAAGGEHAPNH